MTFIHQVSDTVKVYGLEFIPKQVQGFPFKSRLVLDFGKHSFAIEWGKRNGN